MYSQNDEERIILSYFKGRMGHFLDLGANDGITLSNTRALSDHGWGGVLVDASPTAHRMATENYCDRDDVTCLHCAVWTGDGEIILHESGSHIGREDHALLSSIYPGETEKWRPTTAFQPLTVPCLSVASLLKLCPVARFEFISIDVEGADLDVLQQMDLTDLGCEMLVVEVNEKDEAPFIAHCEKHSLKRVHRTPENLIFAK